MALAPTDPDTGLALIQDDGLAHDPDSCDDACCGNPCDYACATVVLAGVDPCPNATVAGTDYTNDGTVDGTYELPLCDHTRIFNNTTGAVTDEEWTWRESFCDQALKQTEIGGIVQTYGDVTVVELILDYDLSLIGTGQTPWQFTITVTVYRIIYDCCDPPLLEEDYVFCGETEPDGASSTLVLGRIFGSTALFAGCPSHSITLYNQVFTDNSPGASGVDNYFVPQFTDGTTTAPLVGEDQWNSISPISFCDGNELLFKHFRNNLPPSNYLSAVLSDAGGTYGIKRLDTNATVVAAGTAMVNESTARYSYTYSGATTGIAYQASFKLETSAGVFTYVTQTINATGPEALRWGLLGSAEITLHNESEEYACPTHPECPECALEDRLYLRARDCATGTLTDLYILDADASTIDVFRIVTGNPLSVDWPDCYYFDPDITCLAIDGEELILDDLQFFDDCPSCSLCPEECEECDDCDPYCPTEVGTFCRIEYEMPGNGECGDCFSDLVGDGCGFCCDCSGDCNCMSGFPDPDGPAADPGEAPDCPCETNFPVGGVGCGEGTSEGYTWWCDPDCEWEGYSGASPCSRVADGGGVVDLPLISSTSTTMTFEDVFFVDADKNLTLTVLFDCVTKVYTTTASLSYQATPGRCVGEHEAVGTCEDQGFGFSIEFTDTGTNTDCINSGNGVTVFSPGPQIVRAKDCPA